MCLGYLSAITSTLSSESELVILPWYCPSASDFLNVAVVLATDTVGIEVESIPKASSTPSSYEETASESRYVISLRWFLYPWGRQTFTGLKWGYQHYHLQCLYVSLLWKTFMLYPTHIQRSVSLWNLFLIPINQYYIFLLADLWCLTCPLPAHLSWDVKLEAVSLTSSTEPGRYGRMGIGLCRSALVHTKYRRECEI